MNDTEQHSQRGPLKRVAEILATLSTIDNNLASIKSLIYIAQHHSRDGGVSVGDLADYLGIPPAGASRIAHYWVSTHHATSKPLVQSNISEGDRRRRILCLTPDGEAFVQSLEEAFT